MEYDEKPISDTTTEPTSIAVGNWEIITIQGKRRYLVTGLITGKSYRFRAAAQNSAGIGSYSGEAQSVAR